MATLRIHMLGRFSIEGENAGERRGTLTDGGKVQSLLCYLLLNRDHSHSREALASRFWEETTTAISKKHLRQTLWQLQTALDDGSQTAPKRVVLIEPDWVRINPNADVWLDVLAFEQAFTSVQDKPGELFDEDEREAVRAAVGLYLGDLLEGCYDDWCLYERERLQNMMLVLLDKLVGCCEVRKCYELGVEYGERILRYDHASERTYRRLMRLHYLNGDRTAALRQYERCYNALRTELNISPAVPTTRLYEQIRADQLEAHLTPSISSEVNTGGHIPKRVRESDKASLLSTSTPTTQGSRPGNPGDFEQVAPGSNSTERLEASLVDLQQQLSHTLHVLRATRSTNR